MKLVLWILFYYSDVSFYEFKRQLITYKAEYYGNTIIQADKFYPSSKTCSCCGAIKSDLKLGDRVYKCKACDKAETVIQPLEKLRV